ncbi:hypothetical protein DV737_g2569, partial [Chaetothyriales sp. CBS 132003]
MSSHRTEIRLPTRKLGKNGPEVTGIGYGFMGLSVFYGQLKSDDERLALIDHIYASGERNWDTADMYGDSEDLLGKWFKQNPGKREHIFLATKFANFSDPKTGERRVRNEPEYIHQAIEKSLARLGVPYVDLYYVHRVNPDSPIETTVGELKKLKEAGKIKYIGLSEVSAETLRRASKIEHIDAVQVEYSAFTVDIEDPKIDVLRTARELGIATVAYAPLGRGFLAGTIQSRDDLDPSDFRLLMPRFSPENFPKNLELVHGIERIARKKGITAGQLALAWLLAQGDDIIPIPGTTNAKRFDENLEALTVNVTKEENDEIRQLIDNTEVKGGRYPPQMSKWLFGDTKPLDT